ncbi:MAG: hypothetical protein ABEJ86_01075, partial [Halococcoides sp.]
SDGSSIHIKASDGPNNVTGGETDLKLATLTLQAVGTGSTDVAVSITELQNETGGSIPATTMTTTLKVEAPTTTTDQLTPILDSLPVPQDLDGDGFHGDLNGNGRIEYMDVILFFDHYEKQVIQGHVDAYDADGDGDLDFTDVVELFDMV